MLSASLLHTLFRTKLKTKIHVLTTKQWDLTKHNDCSNFCFSSSLFWRWTFYSMRWHFVKIIIWKICLSVVRHMQSFYMCVKFRVFHNCKWQFYCNFDFSLLQLITLSRLADAFYSFTVNVNLIFNTRTTTTTRRKKTNPVKKVIIWIPPCNDDSIWHTKKRSKSLFRCYYF